MSARPAPDSWDSDRFRSIDASLGTLFRQMVRAMSALLVASFVAFGALDHMVLRAGLTFAELLLGAAVISLTCGMTLLVSSAVPIRNALVEQRRLIRTHEAALSSRVRRQEFSTDLHDALEMAEDEAGAIDIVFQATAEAWSGSAELLLADSSRAHLRPVALSSSASSTGPSTGTSTGPALCSVASPWSCPAIRRGQTLAFRDSSSLAACPKLRDRPGEPCSAVCVPVVVLGRPVGVIHTVGTVAEPATQDAIAQLETTAGLGGSRLGVLRAMLQSQLQSSTDPLTGLLNRRSMEDRVRALREDGAEYAVAFADLDGFKALNDTFGHAAGDRALRIFGRVLHESTRHDDLLCRYGGEEFVIVLPHTSVESAADVLGQIQLRLASASASGGTPPFTASFGLSHSSWSSDATEAIAAADRAMFDAKRAGRNRLVIAPRPAPPPATDALADVGSADTETALKAVS